MSNKCIANSYFVSSVYLFSGGLLYAKAPHGSISHILTRFELSLKWMTMSTGDCVVCLQLPASLVSDSVFPGPLICESLEPLGCKNKHHLQLDTAVMWSGGEIQKIFVFLLLYLSSWYFFKSTL